MKRSKSIDLYKMKKSQAKFALRPLYIGIAAVLAACGSSTEKTTVVKSPEECVEKSTLTAEQCEAAYQKALAESSRIAPKYNSLNDCEAEFGYQKCVRQTSSGVFMPLMTGFLIGQVFNGVTDRYNPIYTYNGRTTGYRDRIITANGDMLSRSPDGSYRAPKGASTKQAPAVTRTISRGGFGAKASAKSSWGGGGKSGGWGG